MHKNFLFIYLIFLNSLFADEIDIKSKKLYSKTAYIPSQCYTKTVLFNQDDGDIDGRSGNKGVEPEALTVGKIGTQTYAFVGLERQNAIVVYDITTPTNAKFVKFINTQKDGDISPEGMKFIEADNSPTGNALLLVAFEMSGSTAVYEIK